MKTNMTACRSYAALLLAMTAAWRCSGSSWRFAAYVGYDHHGYRGTRPHGRR